MVRSSFSLVRTCVVPPASPSRRTLFLAALTLLLCLGLMPLEAQSPLTDSALLPANVKDVQQTGTLQTEQAPTSNRVVHIVPFGRAGSAARNAATPFAAPAGAHLTYFGGPIIHSIEVVAVFWGPNVNSVTTSGIGQFLTDITSSSYYDLLTEYSTIGITSAGGVSSNQALIRGKFAASATITPSIPCPNNTCTITDAQIQTELAAQITAGHLPQPVSDAASVIETFYMIYFPPGVTIQLDPANLSCVQFCAYHSTTSTGLIPYGVLPELGPPSACSTGCGTGTTFQNVTAVTSHEMSEAVTDVQVAAAANLAPPLAWYDPSPVPTSPDPGEVGDICNGQDVLVTAGGNSYRVQQEFSNLQNDCVTAPPVFHFTAPATVAPGTASNVTLAVQSSVNAANLSAYRGTVHFTSSDASAVLPADYTFVAADAGTHQFSITLATTGSQTVTATDTHSSGFNGAATIIAALPDLQNTLAATSGAFTQGQTNGSYSVIIANLGNAPSSGTVTVTNALATGLSATAISGTGWTCTLATLTCTRADALAGAASFPAINVTFNVAVNAPASAVATITLSGGGDSNTANNTSTFTASISPAIAIGLTSPGSVTVAAGTAASYNFGLTLAPTAGTVALACTGLPKGTACTFSPASLTSSGADALTIFTTSRATAIPVSFRLPAAWPPIFTVLLAFLGTLSAFLFIKQDAKRRFALVATSVLVICVMIGCGGGGSTSSSNSTPTPTPAPTATPTPVPTPTPPVNPNGTPAGTYVITVTASGATSPATQTVTLVVN